MAMVSTGMLIYAKVSTLQSLIVAGVPHHVICVYTRNWQDSKDVMQVRQVLCETGFNEPLRYKRDIDTMRGVERFEYQG